MPLPLNSLSEWYFHRTKSHVSVFLKRDGNMELVASVRFLCCGNVGIQVSLFLSRFRHVSWTEISRHVSVMFLSVDFRCCLFPLRFCKRISNLFAITTAFNRISAAPNKPRLFGFIKFQSNANSKRKRKLPSRSCYIVLRLLIYVIVFQQNKEAEGLLLTKKKYFFSKIKKKSNKRRIDKR